MFSDADLPGRSPLFERLRSHGLRTDFRNSQGQLRTLMRLEQSHGVPPSRASTLLEIQRTFEADLIHATRTHQLYLNRLAGRDWPKLPPSAFGSVLLKGESTGPASAHSAESRGRLHCFGDISGSLSREPPRSAIVLLRLAI